jgi:hypothetical protein
MSSLTITVKSEATLSPDLLQHFGAMLGKQVKCDKLPGGELRVKVARPTGDIDAFLGFLSGQTKKIATIEEIIAVTACVG